MMNLWDGALEDAMTTFDEPLATPGLPDRDGFGIDLDCAEDLTPDMRLVTGPRLLAQALVRRLNTPRSGLIDDPNYGFDLRSLLSKGQTVAQRATIPGLVQAEVLKDERVASAEIQILTFTPIAMVLTIRVGTATGPFRMTVDVNAAAVVLREVGA